MRLLLLLISSLFLAFPLSAEEVDPYPGAEVRSLLVGDVVDVTPPGLLLQIICDKVGELVDVDIGETRVVLKALAPGVTACSFYGQQDRNEYEDDQRSGVVEYRRLVKFVIFAQGKESEGN